jgi:hypothetical protein
VYQKLLTATEWALARLVKPEVLFGGNGLLLTAINTQEAEGAKILAAAQQLLARLGKKEADSISKADTEDLSKMFPANQPNGDGLVSCGLSH